MRVLLGRILLLTYLVLLPLPALAATYFVAPNGNDNAAGSEAAPWQTLQRAADAVLPGDTVIVRPGTYVGFVVGWEGETGTPGNPITFKADPGVIINQRNIRTPDGINLEGASYIIIEGFHVTGVPRAGIRSVINEHVIIRNNTCDQNGVWGILTGFSDDILIEGNTTTRSGDEHGIYVGNSGDRPIIRNNVVWGNNANGIHMNGDLSAGGDGIISNAVVEGNIIYDNGNAGGSGINCDGVQSSIIRNNVLFNNHASGISLYQIDGGGPALNNIVVNNTIIMANDGRWALNIQDGSTGNYAANNILLNFHSFRGSISISSNSLPGFVSNNNIVMDRFTTNGGESVLSLDEWRALTGQDAASKIAVSAELFEDPAADDYRLRAGSPAIDAGTSVNAPATDFAGTARPVGAAVDIGAYEFFVQCDPNGGGEPDVGPPPSGDGDGDGVTDSDEAADGTDANDSGSFRVRLKNPVYTLWTGFLDIVGILELVNTGSSTATIKVALYEATGAFCTPLQFTLAPGAQRDLIINELVGFRRNSYGIIKIEFSGQIDGRVLHYRGGYDFAYGVPLLNPTYGETAVIFNTYQPSFNPVEAANLVANWLTLINLDNSARQFTLRYYDEQGQLFSTVQETVAGKGRVDVQGGHQNPGPQRVGVITITPASNELPYLAQMTRYGYGSAADSYVFAFPLISRAPTRQDTFTFLSTTLAATNWVEIVNPTSSTASAQVDFYANNGTLLDSEPVLLAARSQLHLDASERLGPETTGYARIRPTSGKVLAQSMFYMRDVASGSIVAMYGSFAAEALAGTKHTSYNRFLGMANWLKLLNPSSSPQTVMVTAGHSGGETTRSFMIPARGTIDVPLHEAALFNTAPDSYGVVSVQGAAAFLGEMLRVHYDPSGRPDFLTPLGLQ